MDSDLRNLFREWRGSGDPNTFHQLTLMMFRQGWFVKWEQVLRKLSVIQGSRTPPFDAENEWRITGRRPRSWPNNMVKPILNGFQKVPSLWRATVNYEELEAKWPQLGSLSLILKETQHNSLKLTFNWLRWEKDFIVRNDDGYYLIRIIASLARPNADVNAEDPLEVNAEDPPVNRRAGSSIWEQFINKRPEKILSVSAKFLPFIQLVPQILDQNSELNKAIETILSLEKA